ncbi:GNAT family N-acetyltransferase [Pantoea ananatis]|uniref:GNAT family N-acetyltransferase n=1 Tax=Pantoea ananas TaxID=553 RepID=UPI000CF3BE5E|nr:GNAT family N-acetyltransferase [Pantoea ananatis]PQK69591.1 GNAT family N-acetyltransferase [Pantoea ananatis]
MDIRMCNKADCEELTEIFSEMEIYYFGRQQSSTEEISSYIANKVFSEFSGVTVLGAWIEGSLVGFATFTLMYPAPNCSGQLYMKDLFTSETARGKGVGTALMRFLARFAVGHGCNRFDWTAETTNPCATKFYLSLGASEVREKKYFRIEFETLINFARAAG